MPSLRSIIDNLGKLPKPVLLILGYSAVIFLGIVDYVTTADLSFLIFYLVPVFLVTFFVGMWAGLLISLASTAAWFMANAQEILRNSNSIIPFWNISEKLGFFFIMTGLLSALKTAHQHEREMARIDPLTSLANRRQFRDVLFSEVNRSRRYQRPFTLVYMDLDNFKAVNDGFGHAEGDKVLQRVAESLKKEIRDVDTAARLGGDEYALLLPETGYEAARIVLQKIQENLSREMEANGWPVTPTLGAVTYASPVHTVDEMIGAADRLMYSGKTKGGNSITHKLIDGPNVFAE